MMLEEIDRYAAEGRSFGEWFDNGGCSPQLLEEESPDPDMQAVSMALLRAARRAREIAERTNTPIVMVRDGVLLEEWLTPVNATESRTI